MTFDHLDGRFGLWLGALVFSVAFVVSSVQAQASTIKACYRNGNMANCEKFNSTSSQCATMTGGDYNSCYCNQGYFNTLVGCMNDDLKCNQNADNFAPTATSLMSSFDSHCASIASAPVTTPPFYSISRTIYPGACEMVHSDCMNEIGFLNYCSSTYLSSLSISYDPWGPQPTSGFNKTHCICQPREIQLASRCTYDANVSCFGRDARMTNMDVYKSCDLSDVTPWFAGAAEATSSTESQSEAGRSVLTERVVFTRYKTVDPTGAAATSGLGQGKSSGVSVRSDRRAWILPCLGFLTATMIWH